MTKEQNKMNNSLTFEIDEKNLDRYMTKFHQQFADFWCVGRLLNVITELSLFAAVRKDDSSSGSISDQLGERLAVRAGVVSVATRIVSDLRRRYAGEPYFEKFEYYWHFNEPFPNEGELPQFDMQPFNLISYDALVRKWIVDLDLAGQRLLALKDTSPVTVTVISSDRPKQDQEVQAELSDTIDQLTRAYQSSAIDFLKGMAERLGIPEVSVKIDRVIA